MIGMMLGRQDWKNTFAAKGNAGQVSTCATASALKTMLELPIGPRLGLRHNIGQCRWLRLPKLFWIISSLRQDVTDLQYGKKYSILCQKASMLP